MPKVFRYIAVATFIIGSVAVIDFTTTEFTVPKAIWS